MNSQQPAAPKTRTGRYRARRGLAAALVAVVAILSGGVGSVGAGPVRIRHASIVTPASAVGDGADRGAPERTDASPRRTGRTGQLGESAGRPVDPAGATGRPVDPAGATGRPVDPAGATGRPAPMTARAAGVGAGTCATAAVCRSTIGHDAGSTQVFDAGNMMSDAVFYDATAMDDQQIREFIATQGWACQGQFCLRNLRVTTVDQPADRYCAAYQGGDQQDAASVIGAVSRVCGINPQVMLTTLQKETGMLDRTDPDAASYAAAWGWHCPDTGSGGTANCDAAYSGFFNQAFGMAKQWSRYRADPANYRYRAGQTTDILWNVAETGCGAGPVTIENTATASLYNYTPYQPNAASLAAYPGRGDACSSYGNRNFFFLFLRYFGPTGGGHSAAMSPMPTGTRIVIPTNPYVAPPVAGRVIAAPTASVAAGLAAGFAALGMPYVWGGGGSGAGPDNGCARGGGQYNSCGAERGFDCSGLTAYVLSQAGFTIPDDSAGQRRLGTRVGWAQVRPGDIVGFPGHVAVYLATVNRVRYILEASWVGEPVQITALTRVDADPTVYRYWAGTPDHAAIAPPGMADGGAVTSGIGQGGTLAAGGVSGRPSSRPVPTFLPTIPRTPLAGARLSDPNAAPSRVTSTLTAAVAPFPAAGAPAHPSAATTTTAPATGAGPGGTPLATASASSASTTPAPTSSASTSSTGAATTGAATAGAAAASPTTSVLTPASAPGPSVHVAVSSTASAAVGTAPAPTGAQPAAQSGRPRSPTMSSAY